MTTTFTMPQRLLSVQEAANLLGIKKKTLDIWRSTQRYLIPYVKVGNSVKYDIKDLTEFIEKRKVKYEIPNL